MGTSSENDLRSKSSHFSFCTLGLAKSAGVFSCVIDDLVKISFVFGRSGRGKDLRAKVCKSWLSKGGKAGREEPRLSPLKPADHDGALRNVATLPTSPSLNAASVVITLVNVVNNLIFGLLIARAIQSI